MSTKITEKLARAAKACGYVQKDGTNAFHKYRFASAANILGHVNDALHEAGLAVVDTLPEILSVEGAGKDRLITARMTITVGDTESDERAVFRGLGSGMDAGDKAVMKAVTAATKYAWLGAFSISTGDDPEADETTDRRTAPAPRGAPRAQPRREEPRGEHVAPPRGEVAVDGPAPAEPSAALGSFLARVEGVELPGEAVAIWMQHRTELAALSVAEREAAWKALCARTEEVGRMKNARVWLKRALAEEDARRSVAQSSEGAA